MSKQQLSEAKIATDFVLYAIQESQKLWPIIYKNFKDMYKDKFVITDEMMAPFDLTLATVAENLQSVRNIFPKESAERIEKWIKKCVNTEDHGEYALFEIQKYDEMFNKTINDTMTSSGTFQGMNPLDTIAVCLLHRWLGKDIRKFEVEMNGKKTGIIDPILISLTTHALVSLVIQWGKLKEQFEITEDDMPVDDNMPELKDYIPDEVENKPDGTIRYYDDQGNLKEKWIPPEQLKEMLSKGKASRLYRVLIKGSWKGIKEAYFELSDETIKKFVDEKGFAYASCTFKKGQPQYTLMTRRLWERMDEIEKILMNHSLSSEQQQEAIQNLVKEL